ncbi:DUF4258 domain-containing protein [uncultured Thiocystis sp.]|jgi:hypothetical protein|uniref:DUF4258 domain-containing protein n=1 Tax=uncultured Thiocystis sp. TaxID=1202134 RepID=UPI00341311D5
MQTTAILREGFSNNYSLTLHVRERMNQRQISEEAVQATLQCGRELHLRGAVIYAIGRREIERYQRLGIDLSGCNGVQVVCNSVGTVITTYRNRDFRGLRPRRRTLRTQRQIH